MGISRGLPDLEERGCSAERPFASGVIQRPEYVVKSGCQWLMLPHDLPPRPAVYQQARRWLQAGVFNDIAHDLRIALRELADLKPQPTAVIIDARTIQFTPESGGRAGYDENKKKNGSKIYIALDTLGILLTRLQTSKIEHLSDS